MGLTYRDIYLNTEKSDKIKKDIKELEQRKK